MMQQFQLLAHILLMGGPCYLVYEKGAICIFVVNLILPENIYFEDFFSDVFIEEFTWLIAFDSCEAYPNTQSMHEQVFELSNAQMINYCKAQDILFSMKTFAFVHKKPSNDILWIKEMNKLEKREFELMLLLYDCDQIEIYSRNRSLIVNIVNRIKAFLNDNSITWSTEIKRKNLTL